MAESNEDENNDVQMKEICVIPIDQPGHKPVTKKMSQAFFLCCIVEKWQFRQLIFGHGFTVLSNHFRAVFPT